MASKFYFQLFLVLLATTVFASARIPPNPEASVSVVNPTDNEAPGGEGKLKTDGSAPNPAAPLPATVVRPLNLGAGGVARPTSVSVGVVPITPGGGGSFQFGLGVGPIGFGFGFGWPGLTPGPVPIQPYVVVSPYNSSPGAPYVPPAASYIPPIPPTGSNPSLPSGAWSGAGQPVQGYGVTCPPAASNLGGSGSAIEPQN